MPELKFAKPPRPPGEAAVDPSTGVVIFPHATKDQLIDRAHAYLEGGSCIIFAGVPRKELIELLTTARDFIATHDGDSAGIERILKAMKSWSSA